MKKKESIQAVYGLHPVAEAIDAGKEINKILLKKGLQGEQFADLFKKIKESAIPYQFVPYDKLNRIIKGNHQGIIALISSVEYSNLDEIVRSTYEKGKDPFIILLDGITDVRNFGAIARTAECAGVNAIVIPEKGSVAVGPDAVRTSAGALNHISVCRTRDLVSSVEYLKGSGIKVLAASEKAADDYFSTDLTGPVAVILGSEEKGISHQLIHIADGLIRIPLLGVIQSLNVSVAAGIISFEIARQRMTSKKQVKDNY